MVKAHLCDAFKAFRDRLAGKRYTDAYSHHTVSVLSLYDCISAPRIFCISAAKSEAAARAQLLYYIAEKWEKQDSAGKNGRLSPKCFCARHAGSSDAPYRPVDPFGGRQHQSAENPAAQHILPKQVTSIETGDAQLFRAAYHKTAENLSCTVLRILPTAEPPAEEAIRRLDIRNAFCGVYTHPLSYEKPR